MIKDDLYKPFDNIRSRKGRGGTYDYVSWKNVADRMNELFGIRWSSEVITESLVNNTVLVRVRVRVTDPEDGSCASYYQEGYGGAAMFDNEEPGSSRKSAYSRALKDACKKWGVGLWLEEDENQFSNSSHNVSNIIPPSVPNMMPPSAPSMAPPSAPSMIPPCVPNTSSMAPPSAPNMIPPSVSNPSVLGAPGIPVSSPVIATSTPNTYNAPSNMNSDKQPPIPMMPSNQQSFEPPEETESIALITNVQEMAIKNMVRLNNSVGTEDEWIALLAADPVNNIRNNPAPKLKELTYEEAVSVITSAKR